jgi:hypothetical protein
MQSYSVISTQWNLQLVSPLQNLQCVALSPKDYQPPQQPGSDSNKNLQDPNPTQFYTPIVKTDNKQLKEMMVLRSAKNLKAIKQVDELGLLKKKENNTLRKQQEEEEKRKKDKEESEQHKLEEENSLKIAAQPTQDEHDANSPRIYTTL